MTYSQPNAPMPHRVGKSRAWSRGGGARGVDSGGCVGRHPVRRRRRTRPVGGEARQLQCLVRVCQLSGILHVVALWAGCERLSARCVEGGKVEKKNGGSLALHTAPHAAQSSSFSSRHMLRVDAPLCVQSASVHAQLVR